MDSSRHRRGHRILLVLTMTSLILANRIAGQKCGRGFFSNGARCDPCLKCGFGFELKPNSPHSCTATYSDCRECPPDTFKDTEDAAGRCKSCNATEQICPDSFWVPCSKTADGACRECPKNHHGSDCDRCLTDSQCLNREKIISHCTPDNDAQCGTRATAPALTSPPTPALSTTSPKSPTSEAATDRLISLSFRRRTTAESTLPIAHYTNSLPMSLSTAESTSSRPVFSTFNKPARTDKSLDALEVVAIVVVVCILVLVLAAVAVALLRSHYQETAGKTTTKLEEDPVSSSENDYVELSPRNLDTPDEGKVATDEGKVAPDNLQKKLDLLKPECVLPTPVASESPSLRSSTATRSTSEDSSQVGQNSTAEVYDIDYESNPPGVVESAMTSSPRKVQTCYITILAENCTFTSTRSHPVVASDVTDTYLTLQSPTQEEAGNIVPHVDSVAEDQHVTTVPDQVQNHPIVDSQPHCHNPPIYNPSL